MTPALPHLAVRPLVAVTLVVGAALTALSGCYGFHRDELYFIAAADRPALGYVDQPPLTPLLAGASVAVFGDTPMGLRVVATLAFMGSILLVGLIARELGAGRRAQVLGVVAASISGYPLAVGHMVSTSTVDVLAWLALSWVALRLMRGGDPRWWLAAGAIAGVGILNKYLVVALGAALLIGWLLAGPRRLLATWWLPAGLVVAALIVAPNLWWQAANDWPQLTVAAGISANDGLENRIKLIPEQILLLSPVLVPVWVTGWWRLWRREELRWARPFAVAYPVMCLVILVVGGKGYYPLPLLMVLLAARTVPTMAWADRARSNRVVLGSALVLGGAASAVIALPVLPVTAIGVPNAINREQGEQVGWPELTMAVAEGWQRIPESDRAPATIFAYNYGQAGAIEHYGPGHGLPAPYSGHMSYADWGPPPDDLTGPVVIIHHPRAPIDPAQFRDCSPVERVDNGYGVDNEEQGSIVELCDGPAMAWSALWPQLRHAY